MNHLENYVRYKNDAWAFITECVFTLDQVDKHNPIKRFPNREYLKLLCKTWQKYPLFAVPKSRRMTVSWTFISLYLWDTIFNKGRFQAFVSKKEDDAHELVQRAKFILDHIDEDKLPRDLIPQYKDKYCTLEFPEINSVIRGFPQGADQLRQFTFSGILGDECAFWEHAQKFYSASFPTIDGGGRMSLVSSPAPGFFKRLCYDRMDSVIADEIAEHVADFKTPMEGVKMWYNNKNRFAVMELHYKADPKKRSDEYRESIKNSMPLIEYLREYELSWDTFEGFPVFPEFLPIHKITEEPTPQPGLPMLIGFDFGLTPAAVVGQLQGDQLVIFKEFVEVNKAADVFIPEVISKLRMYYPEYSDLRKNWLCYGDPSGTFRKDTDANTCFRILHENGFNPQPGPVTWEARRSNVVYFLQKLGKEGPAFQIYVPDCPTLVKGFEGGYRFPDRAGEIEPSKLRPIKDHFSHAHDAYQYLASGVRAISGRTSVSIPRPRYASGFMQKDELWQQMQKIRKL